MDAIDEKDIWTGVILKILFLEPFFGGSHKDFALGFQAHSRHDIDLVSMPARLKPLCLAHRVSGPAVENVHLKW